MKLLLLILLLIPVQIVAAQTEPVTTCTVVAPSVSVRCDGFTYSVRKLHEDPNVDRELRRQWRLVAPMRDGRPDVDQPLAEAPVQVGQQVKAIITADKFQPVGTCEVRVWQNIKSWRQGRDEQIPNSLYTLPNDCQSWHGTVYMGGPNAGILIESSGETAQQPADRTEKRCVVTEVVTEGIRSHDCGGWQPVKGEKIWMPTAVSRRLKKVGDVFYFVWKSDRWEAEIR